MADSGAMRDVERWVRDVWLPGHVAGTHRFMPQRVRLDAGGYFDFDAVSDDHSVAVCVCTSAGVTSGGKKGTSHLNKIRSDILFLTMAQGVERKFVGPLAPEAHAQFCYAVSGFTSRRANLRRGRRRR